MGGNVSLYNEGGEGPIYPTPVVGLVGELPDARARRPARLPGRGRLDRAGDRRLGAVARRPRSSPSCAARPSRGRCPRVDLGESRRCTPRSARPSGPARCTPRTTSPRAASRSRWPSPHRLRPRRDGVGLVAEAELFGEGPGAFLVSGPASALDGVRRRRARDRRRSAATRSTIEGVLSVPLDELDRAFTYGLADLLH